MFTESEIQKNNIESALNPKRIVQLFLKPKTFFENIKKFDMRHIHIVTYSVAILTVMDRIDGKLVKNTLSANPDFSAYSFILDSWGGYWFSVLGLATIASIIVWFFYGWWYEIRLKWCGVENIDTSLARQVNVLQWFVVAFPTIITAIVQTFLYGNYLETFLSEEIWSGIIFILFSFYSCWVSYTASKVVFSANNKALMWFLILPVVVYFVIFFGIFVAAITSFHT